MRTAYLIVKRLFDIVCSLMGLVVSLPAWPLTALGIELSDPGPLFYIAKRTTKHDRVFNMLKFRSMRQGEANEAVFRGEEDRIFPFGALIRALKVDELPQLLNILIGDMTIVGPRPASVWQVETTRGGRFARTGSVTSGLTGPSALFDYLYEDLYGDCAKTQEIYVRDVLPHRLELDLVYLDRQGARFDLKMIWWTAVCIFNHIIRRKPVRIYQTLVRWSNEHRVKEEREWKES